MNSVVSLHVKSVTILVLIFLLAGMLALATPQGMVSAAGLSEEPQPPAADAVQEPVRLERLYQRALRQLEAQANRLERTAEMVTRAEERIAALKEAGKDTSPLEEALADAVQQVAEAQVAHDHAAEILTAHAGFDADGKLKDATAAKETVKEAGKSLREAAHNLRPVLRDLLHALRQFRRANQ